MNLSVDSLRPTTREMKLEEQACPIESETVQLIICFRLVWNYYSVISQSTMESDAYQIQIQIYFIASYYINSHKV